MHENYVSSTRIAALAAWVVVFLLLLKAWVTLIVARDLWEYAALMAMTGCAMSAVAATLSIKVYAARQCALIRALSGLEDGGIPRSAEVRSLR